MSINISSVWVMCAFWIATDAVKWALGFTVSDGMIAGDICVAVFCVALTFLSAFRVWIFGRGAA